jgi:SAM-dependent methyltransferase
MSNYDYSIHYSRFHDETHDHAERMAEWQLHLLKRYSPQDRDLPVLDIGCGYGFGMRALRHLGFSSIEGVELSSEQARVAVKAGFQVHLTEDTEKFLLDRPGKYGFIVLMDVLEHLPVERQIDLLRAIHGALLPSGRLFMTVPNANSPLASRWRYIDFTHYSSFTEHTVQFVLRNAGFSEVKVCAEKGIGRFPRRFWLKSERASVRKWIVRWCWLQVFKCEIPWEKIEDISFELNLNVQADKNAS